MIWEYRQGLDQLSGIHHYQALRSNHHHHLHHKAIIGKLFKRHYHPVHLLSPLHDRNLLLDLCPLDLDLLPIPLSQVILGQASYRHNRLVLPEQKVVRLHLRDGDQYC